VPTNDVRQLLYEPELRYPGGLTITRETAPSVNSYGERVAGATSPVVLDPVVIHNASGRDLTRLPEADRTTAHVKGYSLLRVYASDSGFRDYFTYSGRQYLIDHVEDYDVQGGVYIWMAALIEQGATP
jgi:hypothetical protein